MGDHTTPAPTRAEQRIDTLDVLRGVAICGILLMNIPYMGAIGETEGLAYPARWNADWIAWIVQGLVFEGTMRGLFTMLFGAGLLLMLRDAEGEKAEVAPFDVWARRCLALMALGIVQFAIFFWPGEILWTYGIAGFGLLAYRVAKPRTLLIWAAIIIIGISSYSVWRAAGRTTLMLGSIPAQAAKDAGKTLTEDQTRALEAAKKAHERYHPTKEAIAKEYNERTTLPTLLAWSADQWAELHTSTESWIGGVAESLGFMLIGMALFRTGILTGDAPLSTYWRLAAIAYPIGFAIRIGGFLYQSRTGFELDVHRIIPAIVYLRNFGYEPARLAITLGHVGLLIGLYKSGAFGRAWPVRATGRMALTVYSLQSILTSILFYGFGYVGAFGFTTLMAIAVAIWIVTALFSIWWLSRDDMGPAERALRRVAYGKAAARKAGPLPDGLIEPAMTPSPA